MYLAFELFGELAVTDEQPDAVIVFVGQAPGRFDDVFVPLEVKQPATLTRTTASLGIWYLRRKLVICDW